MENKEYNKLSKEFFSKQRETISTEESMKDVIPFEFSDDVIKGKKKIFITNGKYIKEKNHKDYLNEALKDEEFRKAWEEVQLDYEIVNQIIDKTLKRNISYKELSKRAGVSINTINNILMANANPSLNTLKRIANALDCTLSITFKEVK